MSIFRFVEYNLSMFPSNRSNADITFGSLVVIILETIKSIIPGLHIMEKAQMHLFILVFDPGIDSFIPLVLV